MEIDWRTKCSSSVRQSRRLFSDQAPSFPGMPATPFIYQRGFEKALGGKPILRGNRQ
jgi:hypothetical protein